jgi:hypothetical protein
MGLSLGGGSSSGNTNAVVTPEQTKQNQLTNELLGTLVPAYQKTVSGAQNAYDTSTPFVNKAALQGFNTSQTTGEALNKGGLTALSNASNTLGSIINPDYINNTVQGYLQPVVEQNRDLASALDAQFLGAGQGGSSRHAFSQSNLAGLNSARLQSAGTKAIADITGQQISAATGLGNAGATAVTGSQNANKDALAFAGAPQTSYQQFANTIFGVPGGASTANFTGTQGQNTSSKGFGGSGKVS